MTVLTIEPTVGFGEIRFGANRETARRLLGEPSRAIDSSEEQGSEIWLYDGLGVAVYFSGSGALTAFEIFNREATLRGHQIIGLEVEEAAVLLRREFAFPIEALIDDDEAVEQLRIPELNVSVWVEDDLVSSVSWSDATVPDSAPVPPPN
jgi:hypothetical protein